MADLLSPADIEAEAAKVGKTIKQVCQDAGIAQSTFSRWKGGDTEPTMSVYRRLVAAVQPAAA